jgi:hypothetical protein
MIDWLVFIHPFIQNLDKTFELYYDHNVKIKYRVA